MLLCYLPTYVHTYVRKSALLCTIILLETNLTDNGYTVFAAKMSWMFAIFLCESDLKATIHPCTHIHYTNKMSTLDPDTISTPPNSSTHTAYLCRSPSSSTNTKEGPLVLPICIAMHNYTTDTTRCAFGGTVEL